jgi:hypothetical protein
MAGSKPQRRSQWSKWSSLPPHQLNGLKPLFCSSAAPEPPGGPCAPRAGGCAQQRPRQPQAASCAAAARDAPGSRRRSWLQSREHRRAAAARRHPRARQPAPARQEGARAAGVTTRLSHHRDSDAAGRDALRTRVQAAASASRAPLTFVVAREQQGAGRTRATGANIQARQSPTRDDRRRAGGAPALRNARAPAPPPAPWTRHSGTPPARGEPPCEEPWWTSAQERRGKGE